MMGSRDSLKAQLYPSPVRPVRPVRSKGNSHSDDLKTSQDHLFECPVVLDSTASTAKLMLYTLGRHTPMILRRGSRFSHFLNIYIYILFEGLGVSTST